MALKVKTQWQFIKQNISQTLQTTQWNFKFQKRWHSVFVGMDLTILDTVFVKCSVLTFRASVEFSQNPWISCQIDIFWEFVNPYLISDTLQHFWWMTKIYTHYLLFIISYSNSPGLKPFSSRAEIQWELELTRLRLPPKAQKVSPAALFHLPSPVSPRPIIKITFFFIMAGERH